MKNLHRYRCPSFTTGGAADKGSTSPPKNGERDERYAVDHHRPPRASASRRSRSVFDDAATRRRIAELDERSRAHDFWNDPDSAQLVMKELAELREQAGSLDAVAGGLRDAREILDLFDGDPAAESEAERSIAAARSAIDALEMAASFSGEFDSHDAIVSIFAGAGGVDAADWAADADAHVSALGRIQGIRDAGSSRSRRPKKRA